jgi:hypothetical protein
VACPYVLGTVTCSSTCSAGISEWPGWVHVVLPVLVRAVIPGQEILEDCPCIVTVICPSTPIADLSERPLQDNMEVLTASTAEGVCAIGAGINTNVKQVIAEAFKEGLGSL